MLIFIEFIKLVAKTHLINSIKYEHSCEILYITLCMPCIIAHSKEVSRVPWLYQYAPGGFMLFVVLCPGTPEGSTGTGSGFKSSQKTGQRLKVSSERLGEAGNRTCDPWFTRNRFIPTPFCGFPWVETSTAGRVYDLCVYYMTGAPEGSPKVVLCGFLWFYGEAGNRTFDPWFTRHSAYPIHHGGFTYYFKANHFY